MSRLRAALGLVALGALVALCAVSHAPIARIVESPALAGPGGLALFAIAFVAATLLMTPSTPMCIAAGLLYGPLTGTLLVVLSSFVADYLCFRVARSVGRRWAERQLERAPRLKALDGMFAAHGFRAVTLLRLSPLAPYNVLNYALGLTGVSTSSFLLGSAVGSLPWTVLFVLLGAFGGAAAAAESARHAWFLAIALAITAIISAALARMAKRALAREMAP